ncbi:hypothetical protein ID866_2389 [Astraeus odoratus]|nr:hypothetical protein ID866_2389 [Astraeus odoratus]
MSTRCYQDAIELLNSLQTNAAVLEAARAAGPRLNPNAIPEMIEFLERIEYTCEDLNGLNVIHITGTKGKGSASAFTDSILRHVKPDWKVGLYTSPHLVAVRERIRIGGKPLSEEDFAKYFFEVWDRLQKNGPRTPEFPMMPNYFRYLTLMAYHAFMSEKVDATILEVGIGGAGDSTNIVPKPVVTGITALGLDHTAVLGKTIDAIAWQKGGIYKEGVPALSVDQPEEGMKVLKQRAQESQAAYFMEVPSLPGGSSVRLGIVVALVVLFAGLENTKWPGRCQTVLDPDHQHTTWYFDGAHTTESLSCCTHWFVQPGVGLPKVSEPRPSRVLIFNCTSGRSGSNFLGTILDRIRDLLVRHGSEEKVESFFDQIIFCSNVTYADGHFKGDLTSRALSTADLVHLKTQHELASAWSRLVPTYPSDAVHVLPSIEHAIRTVRKFSNSAEKISVLVTGSLHLVGGVIEVAGLSSIAL